jgi:hypothetical protein
MTAYVATSLTVVCGIETMRADRRRAQLHRSTVATETVYRKQLRPVVEGGADVMDQIFPPETGTGA